MSDSYYDIMKKGTDSFSSKQKKELLVSAGIVDRDTKKVTKKYEKVYSYKK